MSLMGLLHGFGETLLFCLEEEAQVLSRLHTWCYPFLHTAPVTMNGPVNMNQCVCKFLRRGREGLQRTQAIQMEALKSHCLYSGSCLTTPQLCDFEHAIL